MLFNDLVSLDPWVEMDKLRREMNRLFEQNVGGNIKGFPLVNIWTKDDVALITAELPGYNSKDINLSVISDELTIKGTRKPVELKEGQQYHRQERAFGEFERTVRLPFAIESSKVTANFNNGVLTITLPRAEADKPKSIPIK